MSEPPAQPHPPPQATTTTDTQYSTPNQTLEEPHHHHHHQQQQQQNPSSSSSPSHIQEWEAKTRDWLYTLPQNQGNVTMHQVEAWINSTEAPPLPQQLKSLSSSQLFDRVLSIHNLILPQSQLQVKEDNGIETPPVRFQRTDQWKPVYTWLESLDKDEVVKSKEISDWLSENPNVKEKLFSRHSRYHLMHYIQKLHMKILKRRGKLPKVSKSVGGDKFQIKDVKPISTMVPVKVLNDGELTPTVPLSGNSFACNSRSIVSNDKDVSLVKRNDAFQRYQIFTELENHLITLLPRH